MLNHRILKKYGDDPITIFEFTEVYQSSTVTSEAIDVVMQRESAKEGYERLVFDYWPRCYEKVDQSVLDRLCDKLHHVKRFHVAEFCYMMPELREQITDFAAAVYENHQSPMTELHHFAVIDTGYLTPADERFVNAITNSGETRLTYLNMTMNRSWFQNASMREKIVNFVCSQECLNVLDMGPTLFSANETLQVFKHLCESNVCSTIKKMHFPECNFELDEACQYLAQLIDTAASLEHINYGDQRGPRKVVIKLDYEVLPNSDDASVVPKDGQITVHIKDDSSKVIC